MDTAEGSQSCWERQSGPPCVRQENKNSCLFFLHLRNCFQLLSQFKLPILSRHAFLFSQQNSCFVLFCFPFILGIVSKSYQSSNSQSHGDIHSCFPSTVFTSHKFDFWGGFLKLLRNVISRNVTSAPPDFGCLLFFPDDS